MIKESNFREVLKTLHFKHDSKNDIFSKVILDSELRVDFKNKILHYPEEIIIHDKTTSNFSHPENFVVFECVHRLLEKGYKPNSLELEPRWNLGREAKGGKADILVRDLEENPYLIIECKTSGDKSEFIKEWERMKEDGGQLFSYFQQERRVKFLCLYTSDFLDEGLIYKNYIINMQDNEEFLKEISSDGSRKKKIKGFKDAMSVEELFTVWSEIYALANQEQGIFEKEAQTYNITALKPTIETLRFFTPRDIQEKRNEWATILRANAINDRNEALVKLINLLLCKITDELENPKDLQFYYKDPSQDTPFNLIDRLQKLYKIGMDKYLDEDMVYYSQDEINKAFSTYARNSVKKNIDRIFRELKYFQNGDFHFIDVYNQKLFLKNFRILLPLVKSLQGIGFTKRVDTNILGDFFETYMQDYPQHEGAFFTPLPLVNFIVQSIPAFKDARVIDFACGVGHFLTQYVELNNTLKDSTKFLGIEKDDRLAKAAKVASFMHQSEVKIHVEDSLDEEILSAEKLGKFTHIISNPPYSVKGFLSTLHKSSLKEYELYRYKEHELDTLDSIECFFIERASQLLDSNGILALILPNTILNKGGIFTKTREILLRDFRIIALVELGNSAFFKTGTNTVILFALRKDRVPTTQAEKFNDFYEKLINNQFTEAQDTYRDFTEFFNAYCEFREIDKESLCNLFSGKEGNLEQRLDDELRAYKQALQKAKSEYDKKSQRYKENNEFIAQSFEDFLRPKEAEKFLYFCHCYNQEILIIKSPQDKDKQKKFLGYEWSTRKGQEGIRILDSVDNLLKDLKTPMYNHNDKLDSTKLSTAILKSFLHSLGYETQDLELQEHENFSYLSKARLIDMVDFEKLEFNKAISLNPSQFLDVFNENSPLIANTANPFENCKYELFAIKEIFEIGRGRVINRRYIEKNQGEYPVYSSQTENDGIMGYINTYDFDGEYITWTTDGYAGTCFYRNGKFNCTNVCGTLKLKDETKHQYKFIVQVLNLATPNYVVRAANPKLMNGVMAEIKIPLPPLEIQKQIVEECEKVETQYQTIRMSIEKYEELIKAILVKSGICDNEAQELQILTQDLETLHQEFDYDILFKVLQERVLEFAPDASENPGLNPATTANPDSLSHFTVLNSTTQNPAGRPGGHF